MRRSLLAAAGVLLAGCAGVGGAPSSILAERLIKPPPTPTDLPKPSRTFALDLITRRAAGGLSLEAYDTGTLHVRGEVVSALKSWHAKLKLQVPAFLIRHPKEGMILFDTGLSTTTQRSDNLLLELVDPAQPQWTSKAGQDLPSQLKEAGIDSSEIRYIVLSSMREEHIGTISQFSSATIIATRVEYEAAKINKNKEISDKIAQIPESRFKLISMDEKPTLGPFVHAIDLFGDGTIYLTDLAGRTSGSMGALVLLDPGPVMLAGDAALVVDNYLDLALPLRGQVEDLGLFWRSLHILRALREAVPRTAVVPGHELRALRVAMNASVLIREFSVKRRFSRREKPPRVR